MLIQFKILIFLTAICFLSKFTNAKLIVRHSTGSTVKTYNDNFIHFASEYSPKLVDKTLLRVAQPLNGCEELARTPETEPFSNWVIIMNDVGCDLKKKMSVATRAGYSGMIIFSTKSYLPEIMDLDMSSTSAVLMKKIDISFIGYTDGLDLKQKYRYVMNDYRYKIHFEEPATNPPPETTKPKQFGQNSHYNDVNSDAETANTVITVVAGIMFAIFVIGLVFGKSRLSDPLIVSQSVDDEREIPPEPVVQMRIPRSPTPTGGNRRFGRIEEDENITWVNLGPRDLSQLSRVEQLEFLRGYMDSIMMQRRRYTEDQLRTLPRFNWTGTQVNGEIFDESCSICLEEFEVEEELMKLPCGHYFHEKCIMTWLLDQQSQQDCSLCRTSVDKYFEVREE